MKMKNLSAFPDVLRFLEQKTLGCIHVVFGLFLHTVHTNTHLTCIHYTLTHTHSLAACIYADGRTTVVQLQFFSTRLPDLIA